MAKKKFSIPIPVDFDYDAALRKPADYASGGISDHYSQSMRDEKQIYRIRRRFELSNVEEKSMGTVRRLKLTRGEMNFFGKLMCERLARAETRLESAKGTLAWIEKNGVSTSQSRPKAEKDLSFAEYELKLCSDLMFKLFADHNVAVRQAHKVMVEGMGKQDDLQIATGKAAFAEHIDAVLERDEGELD